MDNKIFGYERDVIKATMSYYFRLVSWVGFLVAIIFCIGFIPNKIASALRAFIGYLVLLGILIILKLYYASGYEKFKWYCTPGNIFLRTWTLLFFFRLFSFLTSRITRSSSTTNNFLVLSSYNRKCCWCNSSILDYDYWIFLRGTICKIL